MEKGDKIQVNSYIIDMCKDLSQMHKSLGSTLPSHLSENIFNETIQFLIKRLDEAFHADPALDENKFAKQRIKADLSYL